MIRPTPVTRDSKVPTAMVAVARRSATGGAAFDVEVTLRTRERLAMSWSCAWCPRSPQGWAPRAGRCERHGRDVRGDRASRPSECAPTT